MRTRKASFVVRSKQVKVYFWVNCEIYIGSLTGGPSVLILLMHQTSVKQIQAALCFQSMVTVDFQRTSTIHIGPPPGSNHFGMLIEVPDQIETKQIWLRFAFKV